MSATFGRPPWRVEVQSSYAAVIAGLACAFVIGKALPLTMDAISAAVEPLCAASDPVETFKVGQSFFEPPGATHLVSANASNTEPAELIAVFVADEGAELTTLVK